MAEQPEQLYCFADEAGNFDFRPRSESRNASRYFILTTVTMKDCAAGDTLLALRRHLALNGHQIASHFHAAEDEQAVRDAVFAVLEDKSYRVDATVLEKAKAQPKVRREEAYFYQLAWYLHFKHVAPLIGGLVRRPILVVAASVGTKKKRAVFAEAVERVAVQVYRGPISCCAWASASDPCLWVADYCCWAIQRKWELEDRRSYDLIKSRIASEFDVWQVGQTRYY